MSPKIQTTSFRLRLSQYELQTLSTFNLRKIIFYHLVIIIWEKGGGVEEQNHPKVFFMKIARPGIYKTPDKCEEEVGIFFSKFCMGYKSNPNSSLKYLRT